MPSKQQANELVSFADFELDVRSGELRRHGAIRARLSNQPLRILVALLSQPGELVTREQLQEKLWPSDTVVEFEHGINSAVNRLRVALGDSSRDPQFIETLSRRGYRWKTPVKWMGRASRVAVPGRVGSPSTAVLQLQSLFPALTALRRRQLISAVLLTVALVVFFTSSRKAGSTTRTIANWRQRQLTVNSADNPVGVGAISPDGKSVAFTDLNGIHVRPLDGNDSVNILDPPIYDHNPPTWEVGYWLPDSAHFLAVAELPEEQSALWLLSRSGEPARLLAKDANPWRVRSDGLVALTVKDDHEIWELDSKTGTTNLLLKGAESDRYRALTWSPDGHLLAFIHNVKTGRDKESRIEVLDRKTHAVRELATATSLRAVSDLEEGLQDLLWLSADQVIFIGGEPDTRDFSCNFWQIKLDVGSDAALSAPEQITNWAGYCVTGLSSTADGRKLLFARSSDSMDVLISEYDPASRTIRPPRLLTHTEDLSSSIAWSQDSAAIYFRSNRLSKSGVYKQALDQTDASTVFSATGRIENLVFGPDKQWILFQRPDSAADYARSRLMRVSISGGEEQEILSGEHLKVECASVGSLRCVIAEVDLSKGEIVFHELDPQRGKGKELGRVYRRQADEVRWSLSPEGERVALREHLKQYIDVLSFADQKVHRVSISPLAYPQNLRWSAAGDGFFVCSAIPRGSELLFVDSQGSAHKLWEKLGDAPSLLARSSPDCRHVAIDATSKSANLWVLEDF